MKYILVLFELFGLLTSSLLLSVQRFGRYALRPSSGIFCRIRELSQTRVPTFRTREPSCRNRESSCRNRELSRNFEPNPLFSPRGYPVLILLTIAGVEALSCVNYYSMLLLPLIRIEPAI